MPKTKLAEATTTTAGTTVAMIVTQAVVVAAIAVPIGVFAVALGMLAARGQTGQMRIAVTMPGQLTSCARSGAVTVVGEQVVDECTVGPLGDVRACGTAVVQVVDNKPTCGTGCTLYRKTPMTATILGCESWEGTAAWDDALSEPILIAADGSEVTVGSDVLANPFVTSCSASREWRCSTSIPPAEGEYSWVAW